MEDTSYVTIQGFMRTKLGLSGNDLIVYAIIYGFSQGNQGKFTGSLQYLADWCGATRRGIQKNLKTLVDRGLVIKDEVDKNGITFYEYHVSEFVGGELSSRGYELSSPNNININKENNISTNVDILKESECEQKRFVKPTFDEVKTYFDEKHYLSSAEEFYEYWESKNWLRGKNKLANWKNAVNQWEMHNAKKINPFKGLEVATEENFSLTIKHYPKPVTDLTNARISWANAIRKYGDSKEVLGLIYNAITVYTKQCQRENTEERFIKAFDKFMNNELEYYINYLKEYNVNKQTSAPKKSVDEIRKEIYGS